MNANGGTYPDRYAVKPKMGFLAPDGCAEVMGALSTPLHGAYCPVTRRACKTLEEHNVTDRFLVVFAPHTQPKKDAVISDLVRSPACPNSSHTSYSGRLSRVTTFLVSAFCSVGSRVGGVISKASAKVPPLADARLIFVHRTRDCIHYATERASGMSDLSGGLQRSRHYTMRPHLLPQLCTLCYMCDLECGSRYPQILAAVLRQNTCASVT